MNAFRRLSLTRTSHAPTYSERGAIFGHPSLGFHERGAVFGESFLGFHERDITIQSLGTHLLDSMNVIYRYSLWAPISWIP